MSSIYWWCLCSPQIWLPFLLYVFVLVLHPAAYTLQEHSNSHASSRWARFLTRRRAFCVVICKGRPRYTYYHTRASSSAWCVDPKKRQKTPWIVLDSKLRMPWKASFLYQGNLSPCTHRKAWWMLVVYIFPLFCRLGPGAKKNGSVMRKLYKRVV